MNIDLDKILLVKNIINEAIKELPEGVISANGSKVHLTEEAFFTNFAKYTTTVRDGMLYKYKYEYTSKYNDIIFICISATNHDDTVCPTCGRKGVINV